MNLFAKQKQSRRCRKQTYSYQRIRRGGVNWEIGVGIYTLLYIKQITYKSLPYSTGNSTQNSVMSYIGKASLKKRVDICICVNESPCCTHETNTTFSINYTPIKTTTKHCIEILLELLALQLSNTSCQIIQKTTMSKQTQGDALANSVIRIIFLDLL